MSDPVVELSFFAGIDEGTRDELVEPGAGWPELVNVRQANRGGVSKRLAYGSLTRSRIDATTRSAGNRTFCHERSPCTIDGTFLDAYAEAPAVSVVSSRVPEASLASRTLTSAGDILHDIVECNGYVACAVHRDTAVYVGVETVEGAIVRLPEAVQTTGFTSSTALLASYSTYIFLITTRSAHANIAAYYLNTASAATLNAGWQSLGNVATDRSTALSTQSLTDRVALAYANSGGGTDRLTVKTLTIAGVAETATVNTSSVRPDVVAVEGSLADTLWVAWNETTSVKLKGLTGNSLSTVLATTGTIITGYTNAANAPPQVVSSSTAGAGKMAIVTSDKMMFANFATSVGAVAVVGTQTEIYGLIMDARPFRLGSRYYGLFRPMDTSGTPSVSGVSKALGTSIMGDWTDVTTAATAFVRPVGVAFQDLTSSIPARTLHPIVTATTASYATPVLRSAEGTAIELLTYDFADRKRWRTASHNRSLVLSGGIFSCFDRRRVAEVSFLHSPIKPVASDTGGGPGPTGPVRYVVTFEEVDSDGNWSVSGVSPPSEPLTITDNTASVVVFPLAISARISATADPRVRTTLYRTSATGEAPYYYVADAINDTSTYVTFTDDLTDAFLTVNRTLYGTGSLPGSGAGQDRRSPPGCQDVVSYNGMLVVAAGSSLWWSGQSVDGEGSWFNPAFAQPLEGEGDVVALAVQDGTLYAFTRSGIYSIAGDAPSDNGSSGGLGAPRRLAVDVGCIDCNSVVVTSAGIFFQSERGIELLNRGGGAVTPIGEKVQTTLASYPVVTSAVLDDRNGLVRFSLAASESGGRASGEGRDLVFDLSTGVWQSVDDKTGSTAHEASQDAAMLYVDGSWRYGWLGTDGAVYYEHLPDDEGAHLDGEAWVTQRAVTPWVAIAGRNGEQFIDQVLLLAKRHTDHSVTISVAFDFSDSYANAKTFTYEQLASLARQWLVREITQTTSQAVRIKLEDAEPTSEDEEPDFDIASGKGATWVALSFNGQPHRGPKRSSAAQRGG